MLCVKSKSTKHGINCAVLYFLLKAAMLIIFSSCSTTEYYTKPSVSVRTGNTAEIKIIELKNGPAIACDGKLIRVEKGSDSGRVFVIVANELSGKDTRIEEKDIKNIILEKTESNQTSTIIAIGAGVLVAALIAMIVIANSISSGFNH